MFQIIRPGETVTASVNAARSYNLKGITKAQITAIQGFRYAKASTAPTSLKGLETCEDVLSKTVTITPDQDTVAR